MSRTTQRASLVLTDEERQLGTLGCRSGLHTPQGSGDGGGDVDPERPGRLTVTGFWKGRP